MQDKEFTVHASPELRLVSVYLLYANLWLYNGFSLELKLFARVLIAYVYLIFQKVTLHNYFSFGISWYDIAHTTSPHALCGLGKGL